MEMEPMKSKIKGLLVPGVNKDSFNGRGNGMNVEECEVRPGGMLVQKRNAVSNQDIVLVSTIKVRVKFGFSHHQIRISSQASFGELKKMLTEHTGVHHLDQKLIYKKKERNSKEYLDVARVKDGSKIVLIEDVTSRERRSLEMLKSAKIEKASNSLKEISLEVEKLAEKVTSLEASREVEVEDIDKLTEILMSKLVSLEGIAAEGDLKLQKRTQERRVQKYIETLDMLKLNSPKTNINEGKISMQPRGNSTGKMPTTIPMQRNVTVQTPMQQKPMRNPESVVVTTKWVTFD